MPGSDQMPRNPEIRSTTSTLTFSNRMDHFLARMGYKRNDHKVKPGLYALGKPDENSKVFVSANYTLSFDALRASLGAENAYILVLDTAGVNVWCAAGKGTFGTDELVNRIETTDLGNVVKHRKLILPQLGAPGVSAHEVRERSGFSVIYGPVRASDLPEYLKTMQATQEMRRVHFTLRDRMVVTPVELLHAALPMLIITIIMYLLGRWLGAIGAVSAFLAGIFLFPAVLPILPTHDFSSKGFILGGITAIPFALAAFFMSTGLAFWQQAGGALFYMLVLPPIVSFLALNFTGSTTFTSRTGVKREIFSYIPVMAWMAGSGFVLAITLTVTRIMGGA